MSESPIAVSFEFSPPRTPESEASLRAIRRLEPLAPSFVSITYGAGGSTRERTHATVKSIVGGDRPQARRPSHLRRSTRAPRSTRSCAAIGTRAFATSLPCAATCRASGPYAHHPDGYATTPELIAGIRRIAPFEVSVSFYPERHPDSPSHLHDIKLLGRKVDAGATRALGQFCFDIDAITRFRDEAAYAGIAVPIVPGIMPTTGFRGVERMAAARGARIPDWLSRAYAGLDDEIESRRLVASSVLVDQVHALRARGFDQFHFYTLNQPDLTYAACRLLGLQPQGAFMSRESRIAWAKEEAKKRILILDGSWGVMFQGYKLGEEDFRGDRFAIIQASSRATTIYLRSRDPTSSAKSATPIWRRAPTSSRPTRSPRPRPVRPTTGSPIWSANLTKPVRVRA